MRQKGQKSHRRSFLRDGKVTHYDLLKWQSGAAKLAQYRGAQIVRLVHQAKTSRSGTDSHVRVQEALKGYAKQLGWFRGTILRMEVLGARIVGWLKGRNDSYRPATV